MRSKWANLSDGPGTGRCRACRSASAIVWTLGLGLAWAMTLPGCTTPEAPPDSETIWPMLLGMVDGPPTPGQAAREAFNVYDADLRARAVARLSASPFGHEPPYVRMYRLLIDDPDPTVRAACVKALGDHGSVDDAPLLVQHLRDKAAYVRWEAAKALQKIHYPNAAAALTDVLQQEPDADVRIAAADALGQYPGPAVFQALVGALEDRDFAVVSAAANALATITGQELGTEATAWLTWADEQTGSPFADARTYRWQPYQRPRNLLDRLRFWKEPPDHSPRLPTGLDADPSDDPNSRS